MLLDDLKSSLVVAMKAHDAVTVDTVRFLLAAIQNATIAKYGADADAKITDEDIIDVIKKQVKTHRESVEAFTKAQRPDLAATEQAQLSVLEKYLPSQMSDEELEKLLQPVLIEGGEFGPMMGRAMKLVSGKADGNRVSAVLRKFMSSK